MNHIARILLSFPFAIIKDCSAASTNAPVVLNNTIGKEYKAQR